MTHDEILRMYVLNLLKFFISIALIYLVPVASAQYLNFKDERQLLKHFEKTWRSPEAIEDIDRIIARQFSLAAENSAYFGDSTMQSLLQLRERACGVNAQACYDLKVWSAFSCSNRLLAHKDLVESVWQSIANSIATEAQLKKVWAQVKGCSPQPTLMQARIAAHLLKQPKFVGRKKFNEEALEWLAGKMPVYGGLGWGPALGFDREESAKFTFVTLTNLIDVFLHVVPERTDVASRLASAGADWLKKAAITLTSRPLAMDLIYVIDNGWYRAGRRSFIISFAKGLKDILGKEPSFDRPWFLTDLCTATREVGDFKTCETAVQGALSTGPLKDNIYLQIELALNQLKQGEIEASVQSLTALLAKGKAANSAAVPWISLYLAHAEYARAGVPAAKAHLAAFNSGLPKDTPPMWRAAGTMLEMKIHGVEGDFAAATKQAGEVRALYSANVEGSFPDAAYLEFNALINALRAKSKEQTAQALSLLKAKLINDPTQAFFRICAETVENKLKGAPIEADLRKLEASRGKGLPEYKEFLSVIGLI
jgi:hypothetical protein